MLQDALSLTISGSSERHCLLAGASLQAVSLNLSEGFVVTPGARLPGGAGARPAGLEAVRTPLPTPTGPCVGEPGGWPLCVVSCDPEVPDESPVDVA